MTAVSEPTTGIDAWSSHALRLSANRRRGAGQAGGRTRRAARWSSWLRTGATLLLALAIVLVLTTALLLPVIVGLVAATSQADDPQAVTQPIRRVDPQWR